MNDLVEGTKRAIKAAFEQQHAESGGANWADGDTLAGWFDMDRVARAAIAAVLASIREPSGAMNKAGSAPVRWNHSVVPPTLELPFGWTTADSWRAMIDALAAEAGNG